MKYKRVFNQNMWHVTNMINRGDITNFIVQYKSGSVITGKIDNASCSMAFISKEMTMDIEDVYINCEKTTYSKAIISENDFRKYIFLKVMS